MQFLAGSASQMFQERLVQSSPRHRSDADQIFNTNGLVIVFPDVAEALRNSRVLDRKQIAAFASDQNCGWNTDRRGRRALATHQFVEQFSATVAKRFEICIHA